MEEQGDLLMLIQLAIAGALATPFGLCLPVIITLPLPSLLTQRCARALAALTLTGANPRRSASSMDRSTFGSPGRRARRSKRSGRSVSNDMLSALRPACMQMHAVQSSAT
jgi:hypothetical protein